MNRAQMFVKCNDVDRLEEELRDRAAAAQFAFGYGQLPKVMPDSKVAERWS